MSRRVYCLRMARSQAILNLLFKKDVRNEQGDNLVVQNYMFSTVFVPRQILLWVLKFECYFLSCHAGVLPGKSRDSLAGDRLKEYWDVQNLRLWCRLQWQVWGLGRLSEVDTASF